MRRNPPNDPLNRVQILVRHGSVTASQDCSCLVNASNTEGLLGSGVSAALRQACGPDFQEEVLAACPDDLPAGGVFLTSAGEHPTAAMVAHVAVMDYRQGGPRAFPTLERIEQSYQNLWRALEGERGLVDVGMVALGGGIGRIPLAESTRLAIETLRQHLLENNESNIQSVVFHGFNRQEYDQIAQALQQLCEVVTGTEEVQESYDIVKASAMVLTIKRGGEE